VAYWCEGAKSKPHRHVERVVFINSDPALIGFFLRFLDTAGIPRDDLIFRMHIHETADIEAAHRFWLDLTGAQPSQFRRPVLKHHNPKTVRKNVGEGYRGCLRIDVRRSSDLYRRIEGWAAGAMLGRCLALDRRDRYSVVSSRWRTLLISVAYSPVLSNWQLAELWILLSWFESRYRNIPFCPFCT
jgi:hypothetical protein